LLLFLLSSDYNSKNEMVVMPERFKKYFYCLCGLCLLLVYCQAAAQAIPEKKTHVAIQNPVLNKNFADPTVIKANGKYYAYATQSKVDGNVWNIQIASSTDLQHWQMEADALPQKPSWAKTTQDFWAPHVLYDEQLKQYVLFYSAESDDTTVGKCMGVAFASSPLGPFTDKGNPLICGEGFINIDPMAFVDPVSGKKLLYWGSGFQPIKVQEMSSDWKSFKEGSEPKAVVWPGKDKNYNILIEGAWLDYHNGKYFLYYSGDNCCGDKANYAVMIAKADNPLGPFLRLGEENKTGNSVILEKDSAWIAPGHNSIFQDEKGNVWMAYHAIDKKRKENKHPEMRVMLISPVVYKNGWPEVTAK